MAGYSTRALVDKLGIKPGCRLLVENAPAHLAELLSPMPDNVILLATGDNEIDVALLFVVESELLERLFGDTKPLIKAAGMIWVAWPKKSSKAVTDLDENIVRDMGLAAGLVDVKVCAVDEYWSGLKFVWRLKDRVTTK